MPTIYNNKYKDIPADAIYVGRPTKWGNPYTHIKTKKTLAEHIVGSVDQSLVEFHKKMREEFPRLDTPKARDFFGPLVGKDLICWCAPEGGADHNTRPLFCHAQILAFLAEAHGLMKIKE